VSNRYEATDVRSRLVEIEELSRLGLEAPPRQSGFDVFQVAIQVKIKRVVDSLKRFTHELGRPRIEPAELLEPELARAPWWAVWSERFSESLAVASERRAP
jgi:hypothetical protein